MGGMMGLNMGWPKWHVSCQRPAGPALLLAVLVAAAAMMAAPAAGYIVAISHRGDRFQYPENTLAAFESSLRLGADYVEVDTRTTADGYLVVIHDETVDRTTNGTGAVNELTLADIRTLDAGSWFPRAPMPGLQVPTLVEVATLVRSYNRSMYLDLKAVASAPLYQDLLATDMVANVVLFGTLAQLKELQDLDVRIKPMPEAVSSEVLAECVELFDPLEVVAFNVNDFRDPLIAQAKAIPAEVFADRLYGFDMPRFWQDAIERGATGVQSDRIGPLMDFLRENGHHP